MNLLEKASLVSLLVFLMGFYSYAIISIPIESVFLSSVILGLLGVGFVISLFVFLTS